MLLNLTEGCYQIGKNRQKHFRIAMGSAAEVLAVLDLVDIPEGSTRQEDCRRAGGPAQLGRWTVKNKGEPRQPLDRFNRHAGMIGRRAAVPSPLPPAGTR